MTESRKLKILFIPRWFPNRVEPLNGVFIKRHALSVALMHSVSVLYVNADPSLESKKYEMESVVEDGIFIIRVYYSNSFPNVPVASTLRKFFRYLKACKIGIKVINEKFGIPDVVHIHVLARTFLSAYYYCFLTFEYFILLCLYFKYCENEFTC